MAISIIDSLDSLVSMLDALENQPTNPPSLYLDIEGIALSRHGSISIIQLFHLPHNHIFLIDIFVLQEAAFSTANRSGATLRSILESALVPKVFFDVRNDADALYAHFSVSLQCVHDIQLLELATRSWPRDWLVGLGYCIQKDARLQASEIQLWKATKERGKVLFAEDHGGSYEIFNHRPIIPDIILYCAQDVEFLPVLWDVYSHRIGAKWLRRVQEETTKRLLMSKDATYDPHGKDKVLSPWASAVKNGKKNKPKNTGARETKKKGKLAVREIEKMKPSAAEVSAAKAAHRQAEKQLVAGLTDRSLMGNNEPRPSLLIADLRAGKVTPKTANATPAHSSPPTQLPTRNSIAARGKGTAKIDIKKSSATKHLEWTCKICSRDMLETQQTDHLAGKPHLARLKQASSAASTTPLQPTSTKGNSTKAASKNTEKGQKAKARPAAKPQPSNSGKVGAASTKRKNKAPTVATSFPHFVARPFMDWDFIENEQTEYATSSAYDGYYYGGDENYGLCDKDCGWCGHCMDSVDI
ncbi:MAG: hypothetical protein Q9191_005794 [Dirinaria sp. TL-2023a]